MRCNNCGKEIAEHVRFCEYCGTEQVRYPAQVVKNGERISVPFEAAGKRNTSQTQSAAAEIRSIYFLDFLCRLFTKENIPLCIYLLLNVGIIGGVMTVMFNLPVIWGMIAGLLIYLATVAIAVSPIGEFILRHQTECYPIKDESVMQRLEPLFWEVYDRARQKEPSISKDVKIYINDEESPNAFAIGRRTICLTKGLLKYPDPLIKAALGHEFGHLAHKDTDRILVVGIGNTFIAGICVIIQVCAFIFHAIMSVIAARSGNEESFWAAIFGMFSSVVLLGIVRAFNTVWTWIGILLCRKTSRSNEYQADEFSSSLGYGEGLRVLLYSFGTEKTKGLFAILAADHPDNQDRINRLLSLAQA